MFPGEIFYKNNTDIICTEDGKFQLKIENKRLRGFIQMGNDVSF